jgi:putative hydrolase of the HAD superfamily
VNGRLAIEAVLFDLDDTLYEYSPCNDAGLREAYARLALDSDLSADRFFALHDEVRLELAQELAGQAASHERSHFFKRIVERSVGPAHVGLMSALNEAYWSAFLDRMQLASGATEVLEELSSKYALAVVSNHTTLPQLRKLERLGIASHFKVLLTSEEAGADKPDRRIFDRALQALDVPAGRAVMVGDNLQGDVRGAEALGMRAVLSTQFVGASLGDDVQYRIEQLEELPGTLERMAAD